MIISIKVWKVFTSLTVSDSKPDLAGWHLAFLKFEELCKQTLSKSKEELWNSDIPGNWLSSSSSFSSLLSPSNPSKLASEPKPGEIGPKIDMVEEKKLRPMHPDSQYFRDLLVTKLSTGFQTDSWNFGWTARNTFDLIWPTPEKTVSNCNGPETPTEWKSDNVIYQRTDGEDSRDTCVSKK